MNYPQKKKSGLKVYNLESQIRKLEKLKKQPLKKIKNEINFFMKDLSEFVFEDFYFFAQKFSAAELFLISFGDSDFQRKKIIACRVESISKNFITNHSKGKIIQREARKLPNEKEKIIFIDDRIDQLEEAKRKTLK